MQTLVINENDEELIMTLNDANVPPSQIRRVMKEKRSKVVSVSKIKNLLIKLAPSQCADRVMFEQFLQNIWEIGGRIDWQSDPDGSIKAFFIVSTTMKSALLASNPTVIQLGTSFGIDKAQYKLTAFCYLNPLINKTEIVALLETESEENFNFILGTINFSLLGSIPISQDPTPINSPSA